MAKDHPRGNRGKRVKLQRYKSPKGVAAQRVEERLPIRGIPAGGNVRRDGGSYRKRGFRHVKTTALSSGLTEAVASKNRTMRI